MELENQYQEVINKYASLFALKHDMDVFDAFVTADITLFMHRKTGEEYYVSHSEIRLDIDNEIPSDVFFDFTENGGWLTYEEWVLERQRVHGDLLSANGLVDAFLRSHDLGDKLSLQVKSLCNILYSMGIDDGSQILEN
jgi:hypothetical protein